MDIRKINNKLVELESFIRFANDKTPEDGCSDVHGSDIFSSDGVRFSDARGAKTHQVKLDANGICVDRNRLMGFVDEALGGINAQEQVIAAIREKLFGSRDAGKVNAGVASKQLTRRDIRQIANLAASFNKDALTIDGFKKLVKADIRTRFDLPADKMLLDAEEREEREAIVKLCEKFIDECDGIISKLDTTSYEDVSVLLDEMVKVFSNVKIKDSIVRTNVEKTDANGSVFTVEMIDVDKTVAKAFDKADVKRAVNSRMAEKIEKDWAAKKGLNLADLNPSQRLDMLITLRNSEDYCTLVAAQGRNLNDDVAKASLKVLDQFVTDKFKRSLDDLRALDGFEALPFLEEIAGNWQLAICAERNGWDIKTDVKQLKKDFAELPAEERMAKMEASWNLYNFVSAEEANTPEKRYERLAELAANDDYKKYAAEAGRNLEKDVAAAKLALDTDKTEKYVAKLEREKCGGSVDELKRGNLRLCLSKLSELADDKEYVASAKKLGRNVEIEIAALRKDIGELSEKEQLKLIVDEWNLEHHVEPGKETAVIRFKRLNELSANAEYMSLARKLQIPVRAELREAKAAATAEKAAARMSELEKRWDEANPMPNDMDEDLRLCVRLNEMMKNPQYMKCVEKRGSEFKQEFEASKKAILEKVRPQAEAKMRALEAEWNESNEVVQISDFDRARRHFRLRDDPVYRTCADLRGAEFVVELKDVLDKARPEAMRRIEKLERDWNKEHSFGSEDKLTALDTFMRHHELLKKPDYALCGDIFGDEFSAKFKDIASKATAEAKDYIALAKENAKNQGIKLNARIYAFAKDPKFIVAAGLVAVANDTTIKIPEIQDDLELPALKLGKPKFIREFGETSLVAAKYMREGYNVIAQIYADGLKFGGGLMRGWGSQEETLFRSAEESILACAEFQDLIAESTRPGEEKCHYFNYRDNPETGFTKISSIRGYMFDTELLRNGYNAFSTDDMAGVTDRSITFFMTAGFSRPIDGASYDENSDVDYAFINRVLVRGRKLDCTPAEVDGARRLFGEVFRRDNHGVDEEDGLLNKTQFQLALDILSFTEEIDLFKNRTDEEIKTVVDRLVADIKAGKYDDPAFIAELEKNHEKTIAAVNRMWYRQMGNKKGGKPVFIGGAVGLGAFAGKLDYTKRGAMREYVKYGSNMPYVYPTYNRTFGQEIFDANAEAFAEEFESACKFRVKYLMEDGYTMEDIVDYYRQGGQYTDEEIKQEIRNSGFSDETFADLFAA